MLWPMSLMFWCLFSSVRCICLPSNIRFPNFRMYPQRSIPYYYEVLVKPCPEYDKLYYSWVVYTDQLETVPGVASNTSVLKVCGYEFRMGSDYKITYGITVTISHFSDFSYNVYDTVYFQFFPDPLTLYIEGGRRRTYPSGKTLRLTFYNTSRDYSYSPNELNYLNNEQKWFSKPAIPTEDSSLFYWNIKGDVFKEGDVYTFFKHINRTNIEKMKHEAYGIQEITFVKSDAPILSVYCLRNCYLPNADDEIVIMYTCVGESCNEKEKFEWYSRPNVLSDENINFGGKGQNKVLVKPKVCSPGESYAIGIRFEKAFAEYFYHFIPTVAKGACEIRPTSGTAGYTPFDVYCSGFSPYYGMLTYLVYEGDPGNNKSVMVRTSTDRDIRNFFLAGIDGTVTVVVEDSHTTRAFAKLSVSINPLESIEESAVRMKYIILSNSPFSLKQIARAKDIDRFMQMTLIVLKTLSDMKDLPASDRSDFIRHLMDSLYELECPNIIRARQMLSVLPQITEEKEQDDTYTTYFQADIVLKVATTFFNYVTDANNFFVTLSFVEDLGKQILEVLSELIIRKGKILALMEKELPLHYYDSYDDFSADKTVMREELAQFINSMIETIELVGQSLLSKLYLNQDQWKIETKAILMLVRKLKPSNLNVNKVYVNGTLNQTRIELQPSLLENLEYKYGEFGYHFSIFTENPFWWHKDKPILNTDVFIFSLYDATGKKIESVDIGIDMYARITNNQTLEDSLITGVVPVGEILTYRIEITEKMPVIVFLKDFNVNLKFLFTKCIPSIEDVEMQGEVTKEIRYEPQGENEQFIYFSILNMGVEDASFHGTLHTIICAIWNLSMKEWVNVPYPATVVGNTVFFTTKHLSLFGNKIGVPANRIEILPDDDFVIFFGESFVMTVILVCIYVIYIGLMIMANRRDRKLSIRNQVFYLNDNVPGDKYGYLFIVVTGLRYDAGTTANVAFQLLGDKGKSRVHLIKCDVYEALQEGTEDWFIIYCPNYLGELQRIRLWHDCTGNKPHWYCSRIVVQELFSGVQHCFIIENWFSLIRGDEEVYRVIPVTAQSGLKSRKIIFPVTLNHYVHESHLWLSIFSSFPQSNFSTKERVSCAVSLLLLSMLSSAMFYGITSDDPTDNIFSWGEFTFTWTEFYVSIESLLITLPLGALIIILFRRSGPPRLFMKDEKVTKDRQQSITAEKYQVIGA